MRLISTFAVAVAVASSASAGFVNSAMIDDFSGTSSGLGYTRSSSGGASVSGGVGSLSNGDGFSFIAGDPVYNAAGFSGISLKVTGNLGGGDLKLSLVGEFMNFVAMNVSLNSFVSNGYVWITFDQIDAAVGNEVGFTAASMAQGEGIMGLGLSYTGGSGSISIDDFEFRTSAVPAPGVLALLGSAGLVGFRRRR